MMELEIRSIFQIGQHLPKVNMFSLLGVTHLYDQVHLNIQICPACCFVLRVI